MVSKPTKRKGSKPKKKGKRASEPESDSGTVIVSNRRAHVDDIDSGTVVVTQPKRTQSKQNLEDFATGTVVLTKTDDEYLVTVDSRVAYPCGSKSKKENSDTVVTSTGSKPSDMVCRQLFSLTSEQSRYESATLPAPRKRTELTQADRSQSVLALGTAIDNVRPKSKGPVVRGSLLIKSGHLFKLNERGIKNWQRMYFELDSYLLSYFKSKGVSNAVSTHLNRIEVVLVPSF